MEDPDQPPEINVNLDHNNNVKSFYHCDQLSSSSFRFEVSRIALKYDLLFDFTYTDCCGKTVVHSPTLGMAYDRLAPSITGSADVSIMNDISSVVFGILDRPHDEVNDINQANLIEKQALSFLSLLNDMIADPSLIHGSLLAPTLSALLVCMKASWKPTKISTKVLEVILSILDGEEPSSIVIAAEVLISFAKNNNRYAILIITQLMENIASHSVTPAKLEIIDNCLQVLTIRTLPNILAESLKTYIERKSQLERSTSLGNAEKTPHYSLGDEVEVLIEETWRHAHIVKINHIRKEYFVEYNGSSGRIGSELSSKKVSLQEIRPMKTNSVFDSLNQVAMNGQFGEESPSDGRILSEYDNIAKILAVIYINRSDIPNLDDIRPYYEEIRCTNGHQCQLISLLSKHCCERCKSVTDSDTKFGFAHFQHSWICRYCEVYYCVDCCPYFKYEQERTFCFLGPADIKIVAEPTGNSEVLGAIATGTVIDILDNPKSDYYKLVGYKGYVCKQLPVGCVWKELHRQRYEMHDDNPTIDELNHQILSSSKANDNSCFRNSAFLSSIIQQYLLIEDAKQSLIKRSICPPTLQLPQLPQCERLEVVTQAQLDDLICIFLETSLQMLMKNLAVDKSVVFEYADAEDSQLVDINDPLWGESVNQVKNISANILQTLMTRSSDSSEKVALLAFQWLFDVLINQISNFVEILLKSQQSLISKNLMLSFSILYVLSRSKYSNILIPCFFRVMIAKSGIMAKEFVKLQLARPSDLQRIIESFNHLDNIVRAFAGAISHPCIGLNSESRDKIIKKITDTVLVLGHNRLANGMILQYHDQSFQSESSANDLKAALLKYILINQNRIESNARHLRILLRLFDKHASSRNLMLVEVMWKEVLSSYIMEELMRISQQLVSATNADNNHHAECVVRLQLLLEKVRKSSRRDLGVVAICHTSAERAFEIAFRRLPKEIAFNLSKAIVVYLSSLVDALKSQQLLHQWSESMDAVVDLIKILFNQSTLEFHHFYEALLARRLLKGRYFSMSIEKKLLQSLPHMPKCNLMISDIERSKLTMEKFRSFIIQKVDAGNSTLSGSSINIVLFDKCLSINILTATLWPTFLLEPLRFANIRMPSVLADIKREFLQHQEFENRHTAIKEKVSPNITKKIIGYKIDGSEENQARINGKYYASMEVKDGWPVYEMEGNLNSILEYSIRTHSWQIKKRSDKGKNTGWAYLKTSVSCSPRGPQPDNMISSEDPGPSCSWLVWKKSIKKWVVQPIVVTEIFAPFDELDIANSLVENQTASQNRNWLEAFPLFGDDTKEKSSAEWKGAQRIIWCHAAGVITLECFFPDGFRCFIQLSEPQASLLLLFSGDQEVLYVGNAETDLSDICVTSPCISYPQIKESLNLNDHETDILITSLLSEAMPILEDCSQCTATKYRQYRLSTAFRSKALGGYTIFNPILAANSSAEGSLHSEYQLMNVGVQALQNWKNQVIDAAIVRVLKYAIHHKCGEFTCRGKLYNTALSADTLSFRVRNILADKIETSFEDILRRCEGLASIGVIEKLPGNANTFQSIAYTYLPEPLLSREVVLDVLNRPSDANDILSLSGRELFDHVRMVLGMKGTTSGEHGISQSLFCMKVLSWLMDSQIAMDTTLGGEKINSSSELLAVVEKLLSELQKQLKVLVKQLNANADFDIFMEVDLTVGNDPFINLINLSSANAPSIVDVERRLLVQVIFESLPIDMIRAIFLNFCKICQFDIKSSYSSSHILPLECLLDEEKWFQQGDLDREMDDDLDQLLWSFGIHAESYCKTPPPTSTTASLKRNALIFEIRKVWNQSVLIKLGSTHYSLIGSEIFCNSLQWREHNPLLPEGDVVCDGFSLIQYVDMIFHLASKCDSLNKFRSFWHGYLLKPRKLSELLHQFYYVHLVDGIVSVTKLDISYNDVTHNGGDEVEDEEDILNLPSQTEEMIPCEFCTDSIPASLFEAHIIVCGAGRLGIPNLNLLDGQLAIPNNRINEWIQMVAASAIQQSRQAVANNASPVPGSGVAKESNKTMIKRSRPSVCSPTMFHLTASLLGTHILKKISLRETVFEPLALPCPRLIFQQFLKQAFDALDRDGDGLITAKDFTSEDRSYSDIAMELDPVNLYGIRAELTPGKVRKARSSSKALILSQEKDDPGHNYDEDIAHHLAVSTPVFLRPTDSLWMSVSNEKSLPASGASRSFHGMEEAEEELSLVVENVQSIIDDSESVATALLLHYKWDVKGLVEDYIDNSRAVRLRAGIGARAKPAFYRCDYFVNDTVCKEDDVQQMLCGICGDRVSNDQVFSLHCLHWYCQECWKGYIECAMHEKKLILPCPHPNCSFLVTLDMQRYFLDRNGLEQINALLIRSFIEERRGKRVVGTYCKNPRGCPGVVFMAEEANSSEAVCSLCLTSFCAACDLPPHTPATCEMVAAWEAKGGYLETGQEEDAKARKLKHLTTKPCPRCGVRIEKNGGCPHMTCIRQNCKYQFCWECSGEFHTSTQCTRPKVNIDSNSILLFDEFDRQCANHFLARQVALKGKSDITTYQLHCNSISNLVDFERDKYKTYFSQQGRYGNTFANLSLGGLIHVCNIINEGWTLLAEAQSALAHACIVMYSVKSAKLQFLFDLQNDKTLCLQQKFEEEWTNVETFPVDEAKAIICEMRLRLKSFIIDVQSEIIAGPNKMLHPATQVRNTNLNRSQYNKTDLATDGIAFGLSLGGSGKVYTIIDN